MFLRKMMIVAGLFFGSMGLMGCPYESQVPISKEKVPIKEHLLGEWNSKDEVYNHYTVTKSSETEYQVRQENIAGVSHFRAFLSEIRGNVFVNFYSDSLDLYYLYRIVIDSPDQFTLIPVSDKINRQFHKTTDLHQYVERHMNLQSFYNQQDQAEFFKIKAENASGA